MRYSVAASASDLSVAKTFLGEFSFTRARPPPPAQLLDERRGWTL